MSVHPARVVAGLALLAGGFIVGVSVLAIVIAQLLVGAGMVIRPSDAALLADLVPVLPFIGGFAIASIVAGFGVLAGHARADSIAMGTSIVAVVTGSLALVLMVVGRDSFASAARSASGADGVGIAGAFTLIYIIVLVALASTQTRIAGTTVRTVAA
ncbi:MAG: hypothetical protein ACJ77Y_07340 [Chloroflexota bacterium]